MKQVVKKDEHILTGALFPEKYQAWFERFQRVLFAYKNQKFNPVDHSRYQLYLLEFGQFNANYILAELDQLHYPYPPFATKHRHTYLRSTDTVATEILRVLYNEQRAEKKVYPLFLDSNHFWGELKRYCRVIERADIQNDALNFFTVNFSLLERASKTNPVWVEVESSDQKAHLMQVIKTVILNYVMQKNKMPASLLEVYREIYINNKSVKHIVFNEDMKMFLRDQFSDPDNKKQSLSQFTNDICRWCKDNVDSIFQNFGRSIVTFSKDKFHGIETLVLYDQTRLPETINGIMGNISYRVDPVRASRVVLNIFPLLFFDEKETREFFRLYLKTPMVKELKEPEKNSIELLQNNVLEQIRNEKPIKVNMDSDFTEQLTYLERYPPPDRSSFKLYFGIIIQFLRVYIKEYAKKDAFRMVSSPEIKRALISFIAAYKSNHLSAAIRSVQVISEVMLVVMDQVGISMGLEEIIKKQYLSRFPVQSVAMTPYAMRAFVRVFQILDPEFEKNTPKVYVTNQSYFEWLQNLDRFDHHKDAVIPVQNLNDIKEDADVIFVEIHPNNVVERRQFPHDIRTLFETINKKWSNKKRSVVVDATLNALDDTEIQDMMIEANHSVNKGLLNVILIQSLTKFSQLGLDKRSAGVLAIVNDGKHWVNVNARFNFLKQSEPVDPSNANYFSYFFSLKGLIKGYIAGVNENVRFVYKEVVQQFRKLETVDQRRFQITMSSDAKACYVALNMNGLLPEVTTGFDYPVSEVELFGEQCIEHLVQPLCLFSGMTLTERMSIGFPLCSVNIVYSSLRFTIGLESNDQLERFAEILSYTAFVLNRQNDVGLFFEKKGNEYEKRIGYFKEKAHQFVAMTPHSNQAHYEFEYDEPGNPSQYREDSGQYRPLKRRLRFAGGEITIDREMPNPSPFERGTIFLRYNHDYIYVPVRGQKDQLSLVSDRISPNERRMYAACFTQFASEGQQNYQNVKYVFYDNIDCNLNTVHLSSMEVLSSWNARVVYGPFVVSNLSVPAYFLLFQKNVWLYCGNYRFQESAIIVKQGDNFTSLLDMPLEDREFILAEGAYTPDRSAQIFMSSYPSERRPDYQYQLMYNDNARISFYKEREQFIIERDVICCRQQGVTAYKRFHGQDCTYVQIDFWREKNPEPLRFLTLMIAVLIREGNGVEFIVKNAQYTQFLFNSNFGNVDFLLNNAVSRVNHCRSNLIELLQKHRKSDQLVPYSFLSKARMAWFTAGREIRQIDDGKLIRDGLAILMEK